MAINIMSLLAHNHPYVKAAHGKGAVANPLSKGSDYAAARTFADIAVYPDCFDKATGNTKAASPRRFRSTSRTSWRSPPRSTAGSLAPLHPPSRASRSSRKPPPAGRPPPCPSKPCRFAPASELLI